MIKQDSKGRFYTTSDPSQSFTNHQTALIHQEQQQRISESRRIDSRTELQKIEDASWTVPRAAKLDPLAMVAASLRKKTGDPAYRPGLSALESMELHIRSLTREQQAVEDNAAEAAEWAERPLVKAGMIEAKRMLEQAENDFTRDRSEVVAAEQLIKALSTPGADEGFIRTRLHSLLGVEEARIATAKQAANEVLAEAQSKVKALEFSQRVTTADRVPVAGGNLLQRGSSLIDNHMAAGSPFEVIDALLEAQTAALHGNTSLMEAALQANEGGAA